MGCLTLNFGISLMGNCTDTTVMPNLKMLGPWRRFDSMICDSENLSF